MARRNIIVTTGLVLGAFAAGLFIGTVGMREIDPASIATTVKRGQEAREDRSGPFAQTRSFEEIRDQDAPRAGAGEEPTGFAFDRLYLDTDSTDPRACLRFTGALDLSGETNYADYVAFSPDVPVNAEPTGRQVCFGGLAFDQEYTLTIREGLPGADGETLGRSEDVIVAFGDKPAFVDFAGDGVILPRLEADGLAFESVNVDTLNIEIRRIGDRALVREQISAGGSASQTSYGYEYDRPDDVGVLIWEGSIPVEGERNERTTTVFPLGAALGAARDDQGDLKAGAYYISVENDAERRDRDYARAWRWILFTDMALSTYQGADGIDLVVRSLETGRPLDGVEVQLLARNNDILATDVTSGDGLASFAGPVTRGTGPLAPAMIMAYGPADDFAALDITRRSLDLSNRDVGGRYASGVTDGFIWLDRGIFRPGEVVNVSAMVRDQAGNAITGRGATLVFRRPNYTEAFRTRIDEMTLGGLTYAFDVPVSAPRGQWTVTLEVDGVEETTQQGFQVEDFVPQRIAVALEAGEDTPLGAGDTRDVDVDVRFLYGAPGSGLNVEGDARIRTDRAAFPDYPDYVFGDTRKGFTDQLVRLGETITDGDGKARLKLMVDDQVEGYGRPLRAEIVVGVAEPGGRFVQESVFVPVRTDERYIGIRQQERTSTDADTPVTFEMVVLDGEGAQLAVDGLNWQIIEEDYRFEWYRENGQWRWRRDYRDVFIEDGDLDMRANKPVELARKLPAGSYRLELTDPETGQQTVTRFWVGYYSYGAGAQTPDEATLTISQTAPAPGSSVEAVLSAPFSGEAFIAVATDKIEEIKRVKVSEGKPVSVDIATDADWGAGFYVLATVVTPRDPVDRPVPRRALGVAHVAFDMSDRTLEMAFDVPDMVRPRQSLTLPVEIDGAAPGEDVAMTIAAVDEGILRLTKFETPDPADWYFGKKALTVQIYDDYGRILNPNLAAATSFGGDQLGGEGLTVVPTKSVSLFNGIVTVDGTGAAEIPLEVPDFNGELRLMAVAWSADAVGASDQALTVRDPVPAELSLPRFLGPDDQASATLFVDNVDGRTGVYEIDVNAAGPVDLGESLSINLPNGERHDAVLPLQAQDLGIADISLSVSGPDFDVTRSYPIQVRAPYFPVTDIFTETLAGGDTYRVPSDIAQGFYDGTLEVSVAFSPLNGFSPSALLDSLYRYPYGCTEQLVSSSWPLLYVNKLGRVTGADPENDIRPRVQEAINTILSRQSTDGAFGLWRPGDRNASGWIGAYVTDFLYRAKEQGYAVPDEALDKAYGAIGQLTDTERWVSVAYITRIRRGSIYADSQEQLRRRIAAYAFYVLARAGRGDLSTMRYYHDTFLTKVDSPLARAHLGAALAMMGDRARAANAFEQAETAIGFQNKENYYQSPLRDLAGMIFLAGEVGNEALMDRLTPRLDEFMREPKRLNTQEKAHLLMAASAMLDRTGDVRIARNGTVPEGQGPMPSFTLSEADIADGVTFTNESDGAIYRSLTVHGSPIEAPAATTQGFSLSKSIRTLDNQAVDLDNVQQNDRFIITLTGRAQGLQLHPAIIVDMLPPGFEIETIIRPDAANNPYRWLDDLSYTKIAEARDDRFVAAIDLRRYEDQPESGRFKIAYLVRAVTPGEYTLPGAFIEDMYRPGVYARTSVDRLTIRPAR